MSQDNAICINCGLVVTFEAAPGACPVCGGGLSIRLHVARRTRPSGHDGHCWVDDTARRPAAGWFTDSFGAGPPEPSRRTGW